MIHDVFDKRLIDPFCIVLSSSPILLLDHCPQHYCPQQHFSVGVQGFERVPSIDLSGLYTLLRYFLGECPLGKCYKHWQYLISLLLDASSWTEVLMKVTSNVQY